MSPPQAPQWTRPVRATAVVCVQDPRLRGVSTVLLRHAGYSVDEVETVAAAKAALATGGVSLLVAGALADPDDELTGAATAANVSCIRVAPDFRIEALLRLFERINP